MTTKSQVPLLQPCNVFESSRMFCRSQTPIHLEFHNCNTNTCQKAACMVEWCSNPDTLVYTAMVH